MTIQRLVVDFGLPGVLYATPVAGAVCASTGSSRTVTGVLFGFTTRIDCSTDSPALASRRYQLASGASLEPGDGTAAMTCPLVPARAGIGVPANRTIPAIAATTPN